MPSRGCKAWGDAEFSAFRARYGEEHPEVVSQVDRCIQNSRGGQFRVDS
ncbi:hypothetical protein KIPB_004598, partial [Kipferlia bialata]|eukprot:g4598.t1